MTRPAEALRRRIAPARIAAFETVRAVNAGTADLPHALERARARLDDARDRALAGRDRGRHAPLAGSLRSRHRGVRRTPARAVRPRGRRHPAHGDLSVAPPRPGARVRDRQRCGEPDAEGRQAQRGAARQRRPPARQPGARAPSAAREAPVSERRSGRRARLPRRSRCRTRAGSRRAGSIGMASTPRKRGCVSTISPLP